MESTLETPYYIVMVFSITDIVWKGPKPYVKRFQSATPTNCQYDFIVNISNFFKWKTYTSWHLEQHVGYLSMVFVKISCMLFFLNTTLSKFKYHACDNQSAHDIKEVCNVNMDVWW